MEKYIGRTFSGSFWSKNLQKIAGEMHLDQDYSSLYLWSDEFIHVESMGFVHAQLHDLQKVSLLYLSKTRSGTRSITETEERRHYTELVPRVAVFGEKHLSSEDQVIKSITFVIHDSTTLFYDFNAFSVLLEPERHIQELVESNINSINRYSRNCKFDREIPTGSSPIIGYFTGKKSLLLEKTCIGEIDIFHNPSYSLTGGADGFSVENKVACEIKFDDFVTFEDASEAMQKLLQFFELLVGRRQEIIKLTVELESNQESPCLLDVFICNQKRQANSDSWRNNPHPSDVLIDCVRNPEEFRRVLSHWLNVYNSRADSRRQFIESFVTESYSTDRLVKAANMFDIMPESTFEPIPKLEEKVLRARDECKTIIKELPKNSVERHEILLALSRLDKLNLKKKVRLRSKIVIEDTGSKFEQLSLVTDQAIDCRNYFVHGGKRKFDYYENPHVVCFFIDVLEFVFAASELIESGWNINDWIDSGSVQAHPFGALRVNYGVNLHYLKEAIDASKQSLA